MSDNYRFDISGAPLELALEVATQDHKCVTGWATDNDGRRLILYWHNSSSATPLPAPLRGNAIVAFVQSWLDDETSQPDPPHLDMDIYAEPTCRVYNEEWGHVRNETTAFIAVERAWALYGK